MGGRYFFLVVFYWPSIMAPCVVGRGGGEVVLLAFVCGRPWRVRWRFLHCSRPAAGAVHPTPRRHDARLRGSQGCVERPRVSVRLSVLRRGAGGDVDD